MDPYLGLFKANSLPNNRKRIVIQIHQFTHIHQFALLFGLVTQNLIPGKVPMHARERAALVELEGGRGDAHGLSDPRLPA